MSDHNPVEKEPGAAAVSQGSVIEIFRELFSFATSRGKVEIGRAQEKGRHQLEVHQLKRDRRARLEKLGREVMTLVDGGEIEHPGVAGHVQHICDLEARIQQLQELGASGDRQQVTGPEQTEE
jgi:hypothetical protein